MCLNYRLHGGAQGQVSKSDNTGSDASLALIANPLHKFSLANRCQFFRTIRSVFLQTLDEHRLFHTVSPVDIRQKLIDEISARRFTIADSYDALHVACAIFNGCDAIVTYDSHFDTVANIITVVTPQEALTQLQTNKE